MVLVCLAIATVPFSHMNRMWTLIRPCSIARHRDTPFDATLRKEEEEEEEEGQASILTLEGDSGLRRVLRNYSVCNY